MAIKIDFWESDYNNCGSIIISGISDEEKMLIEKNFIITKVSTVPKGHAVPTYVLRHSDEYDDCSRNDYWELCKKLGVKPDLSKIPGLVV